MHTGYWCGNLKERGRLEDLGIDGRIILHWLFKKWDGEAWTGLLWLKIGADGGVLVNAVMKLRLPQNVGNWTSG